MSRFLIYLFESGLCLSLFYLGYIAFFRKETYFTFNRIYLVASLLVALVLPLTSIDLPRDSTTYVTETAEKISHFRNYYEELILMTEPDFEVSDEVGQTLSGQRNHQLIAKSGSSSFSWSAILFYIYIGGVLFFSIRLLILFYNLLSIIRKNKVLEKDGISIVLITEDLPSFSFMKWVFVNKKTLKQEEYEQVLAHEKVHVQHKHTVDLLLAHVITIFQWFNPLTWRIQKSIKTCHEYIADRQVIDQGHELFDYQSLLLSQLISIRSVELVNNFNLLSIKKRIAMMNKIKSGNRAKLKALLVIPMLTFAFFFFANMTGRVPDQMNLEDETIIGSWIAVNKKVNQNQLLEFKNDKASFIVIDEENSMTIDIYNCRINNNVFLLEKDGKRSKLKYSLKEDHLLVWFDDQPSEFVRSSGDSVYVAMDGALQAVEVPTATAVKRFNYDYISYSMLLSEDGFFIDGKRVDINRLEAFFAKKGNQGKSGPKTSVLLEIDKAIHMEDVDKIKHALRENHLLKIAYAAKAKEANGKKGDKMALLNLLPPKDAKMVEPDDLREMGIDLFTIKAKDARNYKALCKKLRQHVVDHKKYVLLYEYADNTSYNDYILTIDAVYSTIWNLRKELASKKGLDYDNLSDAQQKNLRKTYPITLTMKNVDHE